MTARMHNLFINLFINQLGLISKTFLWFISNNYLYAYAISQYILFPKNNTNKFESEIPRTLYRSDKFAQINLSFSEMPEGDFRK